MSSYLQNIEARLSMLEQAISGRGTSGVNSLFQLETGDLKGQPKGWVKVYFTKPFSQVPKVVPIQEGRTGAPKSQLLTPPSLQAPSLRAPALTPPNLSKLQITPPKAPQSWGSQVKQTVAALCGATIGSIPVIGGYLCSGSDATIGALLAGVADAIQALYYAFDIKALLGAVTASVENKVDTDINNLVGSIQGLTNRIYSDANGALGSLTGDANKALSDATAVTQEAVNAFYGLLNDSIGLIEGLSIPVASQVRNVTTTSFEVYSPGGVTIHWLAVQVL